MGREKGRKRNGKEGEDEPVFLCDQEG
uniref:Uncharacterized protein n=1 Tax=Wuchereria bancrofti TaxID=6293 RepID=A0AAF5RXS7_WUCBA